VGEVPSPWSDALNQTITDGLVDVAINREQIQLKQQNRLPASGRQQKLSLPIDLR